MSRSVSQLYLWTLRILCLQIHISTTIAVGHRQILSTYRSASCTGDAVDTYVTNGSFKTIYNSSLTGINVNSISLFGMWEITYNLTNTSHSSRPIYKRVVSHSDNINGECNSEFLSLSWDNSVISFSSFGNEYQNDSAILYLFPKSDFEGAPLKITAENTYYINAPYKSYFFTGAQHKWYLYELPNFKGNGHKIIPGQKVSKRGWGFTMDSGNNSNDKSLIIQSIKRLTNTGNKKHASDQLNFILFLFTTYFVSNYLQRE